MAISYYLIRMVISMIIISLFLVGCVTPESPNRPVTRTDKTVVLDSLMDHNPYQFDINLSDSNISNRRDGDHVMFSILSKLKKGHDKIKNKKRNVLLRKKNRGQATMSFKKRMSKNPVVETVTKVLRPLKSRYCTKVFFLKTLRRKILVKCILATRKVNFLDIARIKITSMNKLLLDSKNKLCVESKVMIYLNNKIIEEKKCLDEIDSVYQVVSPVGIIQL